MKYLLLTIFMLALFSCSKDITTPSDLNGKWIEVKAKTHTLTFDSWDSREIMILSRGKEMRDGHLLPKSGSGSYTYELKEGKISLHWSFSSNSNFNDYNFKRTSNRITIDNFYESYLGSKLTFKRLE